MDYCPITIGYCFFYCFLEIVLCRKTQGKDSYKYVENMWLLYSISFPIQVQAIGVYRPEIVALLKEFNIQQATNV